MRELQTMQMDLNARAFVKFASIVKKKKKKKKKQQYKLSQCSQCGNN